MSKSEKKTEKKNKLDNLIPNRFEKEQPTPEQKKAGRDRRRESQEMAKRIVDFQKLPLDNILRAKALAKKLGEKEPQPEDIEELRSVLMIETEITFRDFRMLRYITDERYLVDWMDRNISKAPQQVEVSGPDAGPVQIDQETKDKIKGMIGDEVVE